MDAPRTTTSTPASSPGLFSPATASDRQQHHSITYSDGTPQSSPYLHPLQMHKVRETSKAQVEQDFITGRKLINQYEIISEIGRGVHGKVKLGRSLETGDFVAIKIIQRFSKKRKLGRVTFSPESKTKREIAILKKVRHANVVGLIEVIDDPELKKIYMILEHVELGEIPWRKKGAAQICLYERRRVEKEQMGERGNDDEKYFRMMERRRFRKLEQRAQMSRHQFESNPNYWSLEYGNDEDDNISTMSKDNASSSQVFPTFDSLFITKTDSQISSRNSSRPASGRISRSHTPQPTESEVPPVDPENESLDTSHPIIFPSLNLSHGSLPASNTLHNSYNVDNQSARCRSPSMADSIISHMSSLGDMPYDVFEEDFSYVPCFTIHQARSAFRDTVLGLEYLHYEGIVHRDIKPANLLWTKDHKVKITDFGVSYFGRPVRDDETEESVSEADATDFDDDIELAKTVGTPAFFAPELCCIDLDVERPKITEQIDIWSLGITLYCLIFARIPFMAKDEWQLFRRIAKEDVYIPRQRLKAVNHNSNSLSGGSMKRMSLSSSSLREENELAFEFVDDELYDLLKRMLTKDPTQRIKLREVKRHPWLLRGLDDIIGWLDDTDPSRVTAGRKIEVDNHELERAVVPITFLERARTAVKKAVGKVIGVTRNDIKSDISRGSRKPRRRAQSSATSSGTESNVNTPITPIIRDSRRCSPRGDDTYFGFFSDIHEYQRGGTNDHYPLIQNPIPIYNQFSDSVSTLSRSSSLAGADFNHLLRNTDASNRSNASERIITNFIPKKISLHRGHTYSRSVNSPGKSSLGGEPRAPILRNDKTHYYEVRPGPGARESLPDIKESSISRVHSYESNLFEFGKKHAEASVEVTVGNASGRVQQPFRGQASSISQATKDCFLDETLPLSLNSYEQAVPLDDQSDTLVSSSSSSLVSTKQGGILLYTSELLEHEVV